LDFSLSYDIACDFNLLQFGGTTNAFPALKRVGKNIHFRLADDTDYASVAVETLDAYGDINIHGASAVRMSNTADGRVLLTDEAGTDFDLIQLGGTSATFPAIKRDGANISLRYADDSAYASLNIRTLTATTNVTAGSTGNIRWSNRSRMLSSADGDILFQDQAASDFGSLQFGGTTNAYPALKRVGRDIHFRQADDNDYASVALETLDAYGEVNIHGASAVRMSNTADGNLLLTDEAGTDFNQIQFGGTTSSFPALRRSGANLEAWLANLSALTGFHASDLRANAGGQVYWSARSKISSPADSQLLLTDDAGTDFGFLQFGGTTSSYPAFERDTEIHSFYKH
jgi:hypothetical protein